MSDLVHGDVTEKIIGAAMTVHNELKPGLDEKLYENALCIELAELKVAFEQQRSYPVYYKKHFVGKLIPDLVVADTVVVDTKVVSAFNDMHTSQILGYLNITGCKVGLLLNFKNAKLEWKRLVH